MGTLHARPWQFIIIGLLRTSLDPAELAMAVRWVLLDLARKSGNT